jgi:hypothetical protein
MVWRQLIWFDACQLDQFRFRFACKVPNFQPTAVKKLALGLAPMGHKEPAPHCNITYQTHMEDIQWSGGN